MIYIVFLCWIFQGYIVKITGGNDKQGFPMKQGILTNNRVRLLFSKGHSCYRERRSGERRRKSVKGCIVDSNLSVLSLMIMKKGEQEIDGLTNRIVPRVRGPKRANKIRKLFNLTKDDDVRKYVVRKPLKVKEGKIQTNFVFLYLAFFPSSNIWFLFSRQEGEVPCPQDPAFDHANSLAAQEKRAFNEKEESREAEGAEHRVRQDVGSVHQGEARSQAHRVQKKVIHERVIVSIEISDFFFVL